MSGLDDPEAPPDDAALAAALGTAHPRWDELRDRMRALCAPYSEEWGRTGRRGPWGLRLRRRDRVIVYLSPREGHLVASFALGEAAARAAHAAGLPDAVLAIVDGARRYAEGRAVRIEVRSAEDVEAVLKVAAIKIAH